MEKTKRTVLLLLLLLLSLHTLVFSCRARPVSQNARLSVARISQLPEIISPSSAPAQSPTQDILPRSKCSNRHHRRQHASPPLPSNPGCDHNCPEPLTPTPIGSPCGCVLPMRVRLLISMAAYSLFPMVNELEIEIAAGTYLKQSQVRIMGAGAEEQDEAKTVVDINLVPLGEKFDNTTASLIHDRIWHKKFLLNPTLFGDYMVLQIIYPDSSWTGYITPSGTPKGLPVSADFNRSTRINLRAIILISISAFLLLLTCLASVVIFLKWRKLKLNPAPPPGSHENKNSRTGIGSFSSTSFNSATAIVPSIKTYTFEEMEKATERFSSKQILGEGGFGRVYHGTLEDRSEVAVKVLSRDNANGDREFVAEVEMLSKLHHRNLVKLMGICIEGQWRCLVYELVRNGSVESHLHGVDRRNMKLDWDARLKIALGAARGLAYLHEESTPRVIHRDFKASNVLLQEDFTPKVSDFGLAREATEGTRHISTRVMGTFGYVAPEYAMTGHLLVKSDVYSYGVVLLELLSGRKPVDMSQPPGRENLVTWARPLLTSREGVEELIDPALRGAYKFDDVAHVAGIASVCVHPEVTHRPFMGEVVQALKLICHEPDDGSQMASSEGEFAYGLRDSSSGSLNRGVGDLSSDRVVLPDTDLNRSGPLRTGRSKQEFYRLRGTVSEHALFHPTMHHPHSLDWA